jgi:phage terminase large subunit-like protein
MDGTFLARQDEELLAGPPLPWAAFAALQLQFVQATSRAVRRTIALEFEKLVRRAHQEAKQGATEVRPDLAAALDRLGPRGSFQRLARFFPAYLHHVAGPKAGQRFHLSRFEREFLQEFWRRDKHGRRIYQVGLWGVPKGNGKTPIAAGLGVHALLEATDRAEVYGIAGAKDQARIAHNYAREWAEEDSRLAPWLRVGSVINRRDQPGFYKVLSSDGRLAQGINPTAGIVDEWWLFATDRERESYNAISKALHKRSPESWLLAITTAGWDKFSQLGETYDRAVMDPRLEIHSDGFLLVLRDVEAGFLFWWYGLPPDRDDVDIESGAVIRACNPATWVRVRDLRRELRRADTDENDWKRLHLNAWTASRDAWLPGNTWAQLRVDELAPPIGERVCLGVDAAIFTDTAAVAIAWPLENGRIAVTCRTWAANPDARAHVYVAGGKIRLELIEDYVRELAGEYRIADVGYDLRFFEYAAQRLEDDGFDVVEYVQGASPMRTAYDTFYVAAREGRIAHDGDAVLAAHVAAAAADKVEGGWRIRRLRGGQIDALVASVMAYDRARLTLVGEGGYVMSYDDEDEDE